MESNNLTDNKKASFISYVKEYLKTNKERVKV